METQIHPVSEHQEECLNILQEECAEVIQAASKIKRFGIHNRKPGEDMDNLQNLELEIGDVLALIDLCREAGIGITDEGIERAKIAKKQRLSNYMHTWSDTRQYKVTSLGPIEIVVGTGGGGGWGDAGILPK